MTISNSTSDQRGQAAAVGVDTMRPTLGEEIRLVFRVLANGWRVIAGCIAAATALAILYILITPPIYTGRTELLFDPRQKQVVSGKFVDATLPAISNSHSLLIDSQLQIIQSEALIRKLIIAERLTVDPEMTGGPSALGSLIRTLTGAPAYTPMTGAIETVRKRLDVYREKNTYVITIGFKSEDPDKAARLANRLAQLYIAESYGADTTSTRQAATALESRLENLKAAANKAAADVENYRREYGLIGTGNLLVVDQQLRDLNSQLSLARVELNDAKAKVAQVRRAIESAGSGNLDADSLQSTVINRLQVSLALIEAEEASLRTRYLARHPNLSSVSEKKVALQASIRAELQRVLKRSERAHKIALENETMIRRQVEALEVQSAESDAASVRLRELEREAEAAQILYKTFLSRSKEVWEQVGLPADVSRIVSEAFPPSRPSEPRKGLLLAASMVLGTLIGLTSVWLSYLLRAPTPKTSPTQHPSNRGGRRSAAAETLPAFARAAQPIYPGATAASLYRMRKTAVAEQVRSDEAEIAAASDDAKARSNAVWRKHNSADPPSRRAQETSSHASRLYDSRKANLRPYIQRRSS